MRTSAATGHTTMLRSHRWTGAAVAALLGAAVASAAISFSNSRDVPIKIIDGRAYVAVRDLQPFTGVNVNLQTKRASFPSLSPYAKPASEPTFGSVTPFSYASFGGVQAVRSRLAQLQQSSGADNTLVRYEIVSSGYADGPQTVMTGLTKDYRPRFAVNAILYWANTTNLQTFLGTTNVSGDQSVTLKTSVSPPTRVEIKRYIVIPNDVQATANGITFGARNWTIVSEQTLQPAPRISIASVYDPSQATIDDNQVKQGVEYPELNVK